MTSGIKILITEDEKLVAMDLRSKLKKFGYEVTGIVDNGPHAITSIKKDKPDLILMDVKIKGESDGIDTAMEINAHWNIPIIFLTAFSDSKTLERAKQADPYGYILKPFEDREVKTNIEMALYKYHINKQLRESEERYRDLFENASDLIQAVDPDGHFIYVNKSWLDTLGYSRAELDDLTIFDITHHSSLEHCRSIFKEIFSGKKSALVELAMTNKDGDRVDVQGNINCQFFEGTAISTRGIFRNVTQSKKMEMLLKSDQERLEKRVAMRTFELRDTNEQLIEEIERRKKTEEDLKNEQYFLEKINQTIPTVIFIKNLDTGKIQYWNQKTEEVLGYNLEELEHLGTNPIELLIHPDDQPMLRQSLKNIVQLKDGECIELELRMKRKDGSFFWMHRKGTIFSRNSDGSPNLMLGIIEDVSARKEAEVKLAQSHRELHLLNEINKVSVSGVPLKELAMMILNAYRELVDYSSCRLHLYNKSSGKLTLLAQIFENDLIDQIEKLTGNPISKFAPLLNKNGHFHKAVQSAQPMFSDDIDIIHSCMSEHTDDPALQKLIPKVIEIMNIQSVRILPLIQNNETIGLISFTSQQKVSHSNNLFFERFSIQVAAIIAKAMAESSLKDSEEQYRTIVESLAEGLIITDRNDVVLEMNSNITNMLGYSARDLIGKKAFEVLYHKEDWVSAQERQQSISINNPVLYETQLKQKNGMMGWFKVVGSPHLSSKKEVIGSVRAIVDISQRKQVENSLLEERKKGMAAVINGQELERRRISRELHDGLGQWLTGIKFSMGSIDESAIVSETEKEKIKEIQNLLDQTLTEVRKISHDLMPSILSDFGLPSALQKMADQMSKYSDTEVFLDVEDIEERLPQTVEVGLYRIAQEAVNNAVKHARADKIDILLNRQNGSLNLKIADNGTGFEVNSSDTNRGNGLYNIKERASLLNAEFSIVSKKNEGTTVNVELLLH